VPSGKTGLGQSSLTGLGSELAQNLDSNAVPRRRSVWSFRQRSGGSRSYLLHCRVPAIEAIVTRDATIRADLQDALEVSFQDSAPLDSWRRFPKPPLLAERLTRRCTQNNNLQPVADSTSAWQADLLLTSKKLCRRPFGSQPNGQKFSQPLAMRRVVRQQLLINSEHWRLTATGVTY